MATRNINDLIATQKVANASYTLENGQIILTTGTITTSKPAVSATQTWNDVLVAFTGIKLNVTDTASVAASLLLDLQIGGSSRLAVTKAGETIQSQRVSSNGALWTRDSVVAFSSSNTPGAGGIDIALRWDAANTLAQRNGTAAQAFNIYNIYTSGSVYERGFMRWASNALQIGTEHTGGTNRDMSLWPASGVINLIGGVQLVWTSLGRIRFPSDGVMLLTNGASTDVSRLQFGGTTSSFPALKRSATILQSRLADDSDYGTFQGKLQTHANAAAETPTATHTILLYDAAGTGYKVLCVAA